MSTELFLLFEEEKDLLLKRTFKLFTIYLVIEILFSFKTELYSRHFNLFPFFFLPSVFIAWMQRNLFKHFTFSIFVPINHLGSTSSAFAVVVPVLFSGHVYTVSTTMLNALYHRYPQEFRKINHGQYQWHRPSAIEM